MEDTNELIQQRIKKVEELRELGMVHYRHEVMRDLEDQTLLAHIQEFADRMILARRHLVRA